MLGGRPAPLTPTTTPRHADGPATKERHAGWFWMVQGGHFGEDVACPCCATSAATTRVKQLRSIAEITPTTEQGVGPSARKLRRAL